MFKKGGSSDKSTRQCKVVMLGDQAVGKSSIINRYIKNEFENKHIVSNCGNEAHNRNWFPRQNSLDWR